MVGVVPGHPQQAHAAVGGTSVEVAEVSHAARSRPQTEIADADDGVDAMIDRGVDRMYRAQ
ncbi:hypothetical protein GCM10023147_08220 [Tsukamurella soli]|uniref:Uncharacterized protein n=1 Tax=Tsukamurella soli TaxID=644556 RepID=A0ABP8J694_9ACTN